MFANETLIFCNANPTQLLYLRFVLNWFKIVSGFCINLEKSKLVPMGDVANIEDLVGLLDCKTNALPMKYMGLPLGARFKSLRHLGSYCRKNGTIVSWVEVDILIERWQASVDKSIILNLPTNFFSLFPIFASVAKHIEKIQRDFLWKGLGEEFKFHLVEWDMICSLISNGGFPVRNWKLFNEALLGK